MAKAAGKPRARTRRRWLRWLVVLGLLGAALPTALAAVAQTQFAREYVGREAADALRRELGLNAHIGEVDVDTSQLSIIARDIRLDHPKNGRFAKAQELRIRPSWWALLRGKVDLHVIRIEHATVWLKLRDGVIENLPELPKSGPRKPGEPLDLPFDWLHVEQSRFVVDADELGSGELHNIEVHVSALRPGVVRAQISAAGGFVQHQAGRDVLSYLEIDTALSPNALSLTVFRLQTPELQLSVRDAELTLPDLKHYHGRVQLGLYVPQLLRWPLGVKLPHLDGQLLAQAEIEGDDNGAHGSGRVQIDNGVAKQFGFGRRVVLDVKFDPTQVGFKGTAEIIREGGAVDLDGKLQLIPGFPLTVRGDVHDVGFAKLMEQLGVSPDAIVDWTIAGTFTLAGPTSPLELTGPMRMPTRDFKVLRHAWHAPPPEHRILGVESAKLNGTVVVRDDGIHLNDVDVEMPDSRFNTTVLLGFDNQLRVEAQSLDWNLGDCSPLVDLQLGGKGGFDVEVTGTFDDPSVRGHVRAADYTFNNFNFGEIETDFEVDRDLMGVHFPHILAKKNDSRYTIEDGFLDFRQDAFRAGGQLGIEKLALADFYRIFHYDGDERYEPYQANVNGKAVLDYSLGRPGDSREGHLLVDMELAVPDATLDTYHFKDGRFVGRWDWRSPRDGYKGGELAIERLWLRKGGGTLSVSGRMAEGGILDFVTIADKIAVRDTEGLRERMPGVNGSLAFTGTVKGAAEKPRADLELVGTGLTLNGDPLGDGRAYVRLTDKNDPWITEALQWKAGVPPDDAACAHGREGLARGQWPEDPPLHTNEGLKPRLDQPMAWVVCGKALDGQVAVDMAIGRTEVMPLRGRVELHALDFGKLLPRTRARTPLHGTVSAVAQLQGGALHEPETLAGTLVISDLRAGQLAVELRNHGPLDIDFGRGAFEVKSAALVGASSTLAITGGGSLQNGLGLSVDGSVDLGLLTSLSQTVSEAEGSVALAFKVTGQLEQPNVYGTAQVRGAGIKIASFPQAVREVNGDITFSARRIVLEDFTAKVAGGEVGWSGAAELEGRGVGSYALEIDASGLSLEPRDGVSIKLGGKGELSWKKGDDLPLLHGKLRVDDFVYTRPIKMNRTIDEIAAPERSETAGYDPELDMLKIDLELEQSKPLFVHNNLIDAELRLETDKLPFRLIGTDQRLGVVGNMSVRRGTIHFRERAFDIRTGDIHFDDETRVDPNFDLRATTEVRRNTQYDRTDWRVEIHAYGNRDQFRFELTSEPYLSEDDIALMLTVGVTHAELAQMQTSELTSTAALEAFSSMSGMESEVHRALPQIDEFHVASAYSERTNRTEPQLVIGKRLAQNLRLSAQTGIAESRDFRTGVELELNDKTSVQAVYNNANTTSASQIGDVGVDLKWRLEFD